MAAMVNMNLNNMLNVKDSRWLQLEVCREYQRSKCSRSDTECKFAHPPPSVEVQNGRVVACYDSIKGRCNREKPPCKYFHPPQHLKDQLLINGRNHLALKNALMLQMGMSPGQHILPGQMQTIPTSCASSIGGFAHHHVVPMQAAAPYLAAAGIPQLTAQSAYSPYAASPAMLQVVGPEGVSSMMGYAPAPATKLQRSDRIEVCREFQRGTCRRPESECRYAHPPEGVVIEMQPAGFTASHSTPGLIGMEPGSGPGPGGGASLVSASISPVAASSPSLATSTSVATAADVTTTAVAVHLPVVTVCMDAMRGRCSRDPCRYFHPPPHLHATLLQRQQRTSHPHHHHALPNIPPIASCPPTMATAVTATTSSVLPIESQNLATRKRPREWDRNQPEEILTYPGMVQGYKRSAGDKSGLPVYQPSAAAAGASAAAAAYHQAQAQAIMQLQQPFVPVSCEYPSTQPHVATPATATASTNSNSSNNVSPSAGGVTSSTGTSTAATAAAPTITNPQTNELLIPASSVSSLFNESSSSPNSITVNASSQSSQFINGSTATGLETSVSVNSLEPSQHTTPSDSTAMSGSASQETSHLLTWTYGGGGVKRDCPTPTRDRETQQQSALANSLGVVPSMAYSFPSSSIAFSFPSSSATYSLSSISAAAPTQSAAAIVSSGMSAPSLAYPNLSALAYTGVSLNKQAQQSLASAAAAAANPSVSVAAGLQYPYQALLNSQAGQAFLHPAYAAASLAAGGTGTPFPAANVAGFSNGAASGVGLPSFQSMAAAAAAAGQGVGFSALPGLAGLHAGAAGNLFAGNPYFPGAPGLQAVYGAAAAGQGLQFPGMTGVVPSQYMALGMPTGAVTGGVGGVGISSAAAAAAAMASASGLPQPYKKMRTM